MVDFNLGLLQAVGDPFNQPEEEVPFPEFTPSQNPAVQALLESQNVPLEVRRNIVNQERERIRREKLEYQIAKLQADRRVQGGGLISFLGPVPVGFQVGTYAGIDNPIARFLVDVVADPINLVAGVGALTKLGRASKFLQGLTPAQKAKQLAEGAGFMAKASVHEPLAKALKEALEVSGPARAKKVMDVFKKSKKLKIQPEDLAKIREAGADEDFIRLIADPRKETKGLREALEMADDAKVDKLKANFLDRVASGQSAFVNLRVPFTGIEPLGGGIKFAPLVKALKGDTADLVKAAGSPSGVVDTLKKSAKELSEIGEISKRVAVESLDPTDNLSIARLGADRMDRLEAQLHPQKGFIGSLLTHDYTKVSVADSVMGKEGPTLLNAGVPLGESVKPLLTYVQSMADVLKDTLRMGFADNTDELIELTNYLEKHGDHESWYKSLKNGTQMLVDRTESFLANMGDMAKSMGIIDDVIEHYIHHALKVTDPQAADTAREFLIRRLRDTDETLDAAKGAGRGRAKKIKPNAARHRFYETIAELEDHIKKNPGLGIELVTKDASELLRIYVNSMGTAMVKNQMLEVMKRVKIDGFPMAMHLPQSLDGLSAVDKALVRRYVKIRDAHPKLYGKLRGEQGALNDFLFHRNALPHARSILSRSWIASIENSGTTMGKITRGLDFVNSVGKASLFNLLPFFHAATLTYSNFALLPPVTAAQNAAEVTRTGAKVVMGKFSPKHAQEARTAVFDMMKRTFSNVLDGDGAVMNVADAIDEYLLESGVASRNPEFAEGFSKIQTALKGVLDSEMPEPVRKLASGARSYNDLSDKVLWGILHEGYQMQAWVHLRNKEILRGAIDISDVAARRKLNLETGKIVQQAFGGILDRLMLEPDMRKAMRFAFLAPDWTLANFMMARDLFVNAPFVRNTAIGKRFTRDALMRDMRFRAALGYNLRAGLYAYIGGNMLNYAFTGKFLFQGDEGNVDPVTGLKTRIELPYKRADGRRQFMDVTKQFAEPLKLMLNPTEFFGAKKGVLPRVYDATVVGIDSFGRPITGGHAGPMKEIMSRVAEGTGQFAPIPLQSALQSAHGVKDSRSALISTVTGMSIRSEDKRLFERNQKIQELKLQLQQDLTQ